MEKVQEFLQDEPWAHAGVIAAASIVLAYVVTFALRRTLGRLAQRTTTTIDDEVIDAIERPLFLSALCLGLYWAAEKAPMGLGMRDVTHGILQTILVFAWAGGAFRTSTAVLGGLSKKATRGALVQPRTLPLFDMLLKIVIVGGAIYFTFLAWDIDLTAWLASAGIVGIAVGFAAKDSLANFISGIFILADAPYKIGDFVVLDDGLRGMVTAIGIRSTRILTRDDVEITVPNAVIGNSKIINEAGGTDVRHRISVTVDAAYGSDIDQVHEVLSTCAAGIDHVCTDPKPIVLFREFGASGLTHKLYVWIQDSRHREQVLHALNTRVYKAFAEAGIEIPYSKHDVYIKEMPGTTAAGQRRVA